MDLENIFRITENFIKIRTKFEYFEFLLKKEKKKKRKKKEKKIRNIFRNCEQNFENVNTISEI